MKGCHSGRPFLVQPEDRKRFMRHVRKQPGCWLWLAFQQHGYGRFHISGNRSLKLAHRVSYVIHKGQIPKGMLVMHTCDNGLCVNPDHLVIGTQADNLADMRRKGRQGRRPLGVGRRRENRCKYGHLVEGENLVVRRYAYGIQRSCLACSRRNSDAENERVKQQRRERALAEMLNHVGPMLPESFETLCAMTDLRRADAFCSNYGVFGHAPQTLTLIAERYGITRERVRQLVNDVLRLLGIPGHRRKTAHAA